MRPKENVSENDDIPIDLLSADSRNGETCWPEREGVGQVSPGLLATFPSTFCYHPRTISPPRSIPIGRLGSIRCGGNTPLYYVKCKIQRKKNDGYTEKRRAGSGSETTSCQTLESITRIIDAL